MAHGVHVEVRQLQRPVLSSYCVSSRAQTQVVSLGTQSLYPAAILKSPEIVFTLSYQNSLLVVGRQTLIPGRLRVSCLTYQPRTAYCPLGCCPHPVGEVSVAQGGVSVGSVWGHQNQGKECKRVSPDPGAAWKVCSLHFCVPFCYGTGSCFKGQD